MLVKVRSLTGQTIDIDGVQGEETIGQLKSRIEAQENIPRDLQRLIFSGHELGDTRTLTSLDIGEGAVVHLVVRQTRPLTDEEVARRLQDEDLASAPSNVPGSIVIPIQQNPFMFEQVLMNLTESALLAINLARIIKLFTIIDVIFLILFSLTYPYLAIAAILPICGYIGANQFKPWLIYAYEVYLILNVAFRIYINLKYPADAIWFTVLNSIGIAFEVYIFVLSHRLVRSIQALTPTELDTVRNLNDVRT